MQPTMLALVGCGYAADFYLATLPNHPRLRLAGVLDRDPVRAARFAAHHGVPRYPSLDAVLADERVDVVANLTSAASHVEVSRAALLAGKHVYTEKPLALTLTEGRELVELARARGRELASAPATLLGEAAQTVWRALRSGHVGRPRLVYAELDDGPVHRAAHRWRSPSGAPWPVRDELTHGCVLEHAGYHLDWLTAFFGPVRALAATASALVPEKVAPDGRTFAAGPDLAIASLRFDAGVVARLTCSTAAPVDHSLRIVGDEGVLTVSDVWHFGSPIWLRRALSAEALEGGDDTYYGRPEAYPAVRPAAYPHRYRDTHDMDVARGIDELAAAVAERRPCRLSGRHALHVLEVSLAIHHAGPAGVAMAIESDFEAIAPMPWAV